MSVLLCSLWKLKTLGESKSSLLRFLPLSVSERGSSWGSKKQHRKVKLPFDFRKMGDPKMEEILAPLRASVKEQVMLSQSGIYNY